MLTGVNVRLLIRNRIDGIARFTYETLKRITSDHPEERFIFFFDRPYPEEFVFNSNIQPVLVYPPTRRPFLNDIWFEWTLPRALHKRKPDLFLSPDGLLSLKSDIPALPVIHDLNFEHHPEYLPANYLHYYKKRYPLFARKALRIATVSEFSKLDISSQYHIDPAIIDVVYNGVSDRFGPALAEDIHKTRVHFTAGLPYFLFVGSLHPRKNLKNTLLSFDQYQQSGSSRKKMIIAGEKSYWTEEMQYTLDHMRFKDDVIFTGRISDQQLIELYASAHACVYVSHFEGFGIPLLEAMKSGIPVITSDCTSMPEVAGDAALLVNPDSIDGIADKMRMLDIEETRNRLIIAGKERATHFSWKRSADLLWKSIEKSYLQIHN